MSANIYMFEVEKMSDENKSQVGLNTPPAREGRGNRNKNKKKMLAWLIPTIAGGAVVAIIGIGAAINKDKFWNDTYLGDTYVGGMTVNEAKSKIKSQSGDQLVLKKSDGSSDTINLADIAYSNNYNSNIEQVKNNQNPLLWFMHLNGNNKYNLKVSASYNADLLKEKLDSLSCVTDPNATEPVDAHLAMVDGQATIVEAVNGTKINTDKLLEAAKKTLDSGEYTLDLKAANVYSSPKIYANDTKLKESLDKVKSLNGVITINLRDASETLTPETYISWITSNDGNIDIDDNAITSYLENLASKYDTYRTTRKFQTTGLGTINVGGGANDTYGYLLDVDQTKKALKEAILAGKDDTVDVYWAVSAMARNQANGDIGDTYVEIDVTRQHMWYYVDGSLYLDTDVRTGTESSRQNTPTPNGLYRILGKYTDKYFTDFEPVFHSDYWMPFDLRGDGIHDAPWYSTFGGELYKISGSHGCINTPISIVKPMFENIKLGTPVIVYRS